MHLIQYKTYLFCIIPHKYVYLKIRNNEKMKTTAKKSGKS
jgi:hypothetical protein